MRYRSIFTDTARWEGIELRNDDIIISTPPKCGTTWTQMICALLIFQTPDLPAPLTELSPWVEIQSRKSEKVKSALAAQTHRRFIKSHSPFDGIPDDPRVTYICVGRDPRDVALSWDNHFLNMNMENILGAIFETVSLEELAELMPDGPPPPPPDDPIERFWAWVDDDTKPEERFTGLAATLHHLQTFWDRRTDDNVILLHYDDLQADLEGEMHGLATRLGIDVPEERWPKLVAAAGFEHMKDRAETLAPQVTDKFWNATGDFFKSGSSGQWQAYFTDADQERYEERARSLATAELLDWAHSGSKRAVK